MYGIIKDGILTYVTDAIPTKAEYNDKGEIVNEGLEYDEAIEYSFEGTPEYVDGKIVVSQSYIDQRKNEKIQEIISSENIENVDIEGFTFSDIEIGEIITARVFGGNPYAQQALQAKILSMLTSGEKNEEVIAKSEYVKEEINKVRTLFNLSPI